MLKCDALAPDDCTPRADTIRMMSRLGVSSIESEERILTVLDEFHSIFAAEQLVAERARARAHVRAQA